MDNEQQKIDVRVSDIIVSIAPAAVKTLIGVTSSLGTLQVGREARSHRIERPSLSLDQCERRERKSEFQISLQSETVQRCELLVRPK